MSPLYFLLLYLQKVFCRVLLAHNHIEVKNTGSSQIAVYGDIAWTRLLWYRDDHALLSEQPSLANLPVIQWMQ